MKTASVASALWATVAACGPPSYSDERIFLRWLPVDLADADDYRYSIDYSDWEMYDGGYDTEYSRDDNEPLRIGVTSDYDDASARFVTGWNKEVYEASPATEGQTMIGSGFTVNDGGNVTVTIKGLPEGPWSVQTYHNAWDDLDEVPTLDITVNGERHFTNFEQSVQEGSIYDAASAYIYFQSTGAPVTIVYTPTGGNAHLNGIEVDNQGPGGIRREIQRPSPGNGDREVEAGDVEVSWGAPPAIDSPRYNIYFGTDPESLGTHFLDSGKTTATFEDLKAGETYYWRVDTVESFYDDVFYGRILEFTVEGGEEKREAPTYQYL